MKADSSSIPVLKTLALLLADVTIPSGVSRAVIQMHSCL